MPLLKIRAGHDNDNVVIAHCTYDAATAEVILDRLTPDGGPLPQWDDLAGARFANLAAVRCEIKTRLRALRAAGQLGGQWVWRAQ